MQLGQLGEGGKVRHKMWNGSVGSVQLSIILGGVNVHGTKVGLIVRNLSQFRIQTDVIRIFQGLLVVGRRLSAVLAVLSTVSLPFIPTWLGIHMKTIVYRY